MLKNGKDKKIPFSATPEFVPDELATLDRKGLLRTEHVIESADRPGYIICNGRRLLDLCSNDYLGLSHHPALSEASCRAADEYGCGAGASRLMSGSRKLHSKLEEAISRLKNSEAALILGSGYLANTGIIPALCSRHDAIFSDRLNHASIMDGILLSRASLFRYQHNDLEHLEELLEQQRKKFRRALIVSESLFSMDGDMADVEGLVEIKKRHRAMLLVDDAHATGVFGDHGEGAVTKELTPHVDVTVGTFGKALGSYGAFAALSSEMKQLLMNRCRTFIFSTALPPTVTAASLEAVRHLGSKGKYLLDLSNKFRTLMREEGGIETESVSQIIPIIVGPNEQALLLQNILMEAGFFTKAIRPPTVPRGTSRVRLSLTANHTLEQLVPLVHITADFIKSGKSPIKSE